MDESLFKSQSFWRNRELLGKKPKQFEQSIVYTSENILIKRNKSIKSPNVPLIFSALTHGILRNMPDNVILYDRFEVLSSSPGLLECKVDTTLQRCKDGGLVILNIEVVRAS